MLISLLSLIQVNVFSQNIATDQKIDEQADTKKAPVKHDQADLANDFYASYGLGSIFYFVNQNTTDERTTSGTFLLGYSRSVTRVIAVGFVMSYGSVYSVSSDAYYDMYTETYYKTSYDHNYWQGIATVRFRYINKPSFCMYSGVGLGVTMDYYTETNNGVSKKRQRLLPAGQMTLLGFRVGRSVAFFGEFGFGTNQIVNAGISFKVGQ